MYNSRNGCRSNECRSVFYINILMYTKRLHFHLRSCNLFEVTFGAGNRNRTCMDLSART